jgi:hypothetical protein
MMYVEIQAPAENKKMNQNQSHCRFEAEMTRPVIHAVVCRMNATPYSYAANPPPGILAATVMKRIPIASNTAAVRMDG